MRCAFNGIIYEACGRHLLTRIGEDLWKRVHSFDGDITSLEVYGDYLYMAIDK